MRPLIRYDLDEPPTAPSASLDPPHANARRPPTKKRKRNHYNPQKHLSAPPQKAHLQHWDDPGSPAVGVVYDEQEGSATTPAPSAARSVTMLYADDVDEEEEEYGEEVAEGDEAAEAEQEEAEQEEASRPLTHEEVWDDSALIDAWNSAAAEYEAYHGTSKAWKTEPVKKSPLWYNELYTAPVPQPGPSKAKSRAKRVSQDQEDDELEADTAPLDFDSYVPTHDPSLGIPSDTTMANPGASAPFFVPPPSTTMVSRDEAFNSALNAMYWGGYWTAVYHCQSRMSGTNNEAHADATDENRIEADESEDGEDLVPAQR